MDMKAYTNTNKIRVNADMIVTEVDVNEDSLKFEQRGDTVFVAQHKFIKGDHVRVSYKCDHFSGYMNVTVQ